MLDEQIGQLYLADRRMILPDGQVFYLSEQPDEPGPSQEGEEEASADELPKPKQAMQKIAAALAPMLKEYGFSWRKGGTRFRKQFPGGKQIIDIGNRGNYWPYRYNPYRYTQLTLHW
jgi:hypothetical protein